MLVNTQISGEEAFIDVICGKKNVFQWPPYVFQRVVGLRAAFKIIAVYVLHSTCC